MRPNGFFLLASFAVSLISTPSFYGQSPEAIKEKLYDQLSARDGQGTVVVLHKNNVWMHGQEATDARITNTYKVGAISQNALHRLAHYGEEADGCEAQGYQG
jgi:hypothetical protein